MTGGIGGPGSDQTPDSNLIETLPLRTFRDGRGALTFFEGEADIPFPIRRVYFIHDVPQGRARGHHAHRELRRIMVAMHGSVRVTLDDGRTRASIRLAEPTTALIIEPGLWVEMESFSQDAVVCMFASDSYDEDDYIRDRREFLRYASEGVKG